MRITELLPASESEEFFATIRTICNRHHQSKAETLSQCAHIIKNHPLDQIPTEMDAVIRSLRRKVVSEKLVITKADKGNTVVVMDGGNYNAKVIEFIQSNGGLRINFDFSKHCREVRDSINKSGFRLSDSV